MLIYRRDEFGQILFGADKKIDLEKFMIGTSALTDTHQLEVRPFLRSPEVSKVKQKIDVLLRGYWGWYSQENVMGKNEPIAEVWKYEPQIDSSNGISYLRFYSKRGDWREGTFGKLLEKPLATRSMVKVGWVYFPVEQQYAKTLDTTIQESIKSIGLQ